MDRLEIVLPRPVNVPANGWLTRLAIGAAEKMVGVRSPGPKRSSGPARA
jgi:hypothetical protein